MSKIRLILLFLGVIMVSKMEAKLKLSSKDLHENNPIPQWFTCEGGNLRNSTDENVDIQHHKHVPELEWKGAPDGTKSFALIMDDPDAPKKTFTHWVVYNIPGNVNKLVINDNEKREQSWKNGTEQGVNDFKDFGYDGPCPPEGDSPHHYHFKLYALDTKLDLKPGATSEQVQNAMKWHVLDHSTLVVIYKLHMED